MPTADQYHLAASHLRRLGATLVHDTRLVRTATEPDRIVGGPIATEIGRSLDAVGDAMARAQLELDRIAAVCERRAEVCAQHAAELLRHRRLIASTAEWPPPPEPPAHWVEP